MARGAHRCRDGRSAFRNDRRSAPAGQGACPQSSQCCEDHGVARARRWNHLGLATHAWGCWTQVCEGGLIGGYVNWWLLWALLALAAALLVIADRMARER